MSRPVGARRAQECRSRRCPPRQQRREPMARSVPSFVPPVNGKFSMGSSCSCLPFESAAGSVRVGNLFILDDYSGHFTRASIRLEEGVESGRDRKELEHVQNGYGCSYVTRSCKAYISVCVLNEYGKRASTEQSQSLITVSMDMQVNLLYRGG